MAWSWSHTPEAYEAVHENILNAEREWLEIVWAEWQAAIPHPEFGIGFHADLDSAKYETALADAKTKPSEGLAEDIWEKTSEFATCTNGGHESWCCPFGCTCHMVPFDDLKVKAEREKEDE